jgi:vacuolar protein sorting-associated protein 13A/C
MNGAKSIFNGFSKGITGLITQPVKGAEKDGLPGFFIGSFKGITGLVIKPVSGIIDATTKTAEGIKNTANFLSPSER